LRWVSITRKTLGTYAAPISQRRGFAPPCGRGRVDRRHRGRVWLHQHDNHQHRPRVGDLTCNDESSQAVYKYLAIAINDVGDIAGAGVFDCFANGVIGNLPGTDGGALNFAVWIYAYNPQDFAVANQGNALVNAAQFLNGVTQPDGSVIPVPATSVPEGGTFSGRFTSKLSTLCLSQATWTATCSAQAQATILTQADCGPLSLEPRGKADTCTLPILLPDGGKDAR
jgi:hypothetical protein